MNELAYATLGAAIVATFTWPEVVFIGVPIAFVLAVIGCVIWERVWTSRTCQPPCEQCDKAVRTWMDHDERGAA